VISEGGPFSTFGMVVGVTAFFTSASTKSEESLCIERHHSSHEAFTNHSALDIFRLFKKETVILYSNQSVQTMT
jgi:hypothetical protein